MLFSYLWQENVAFPTQTCSFVCEFGLIAANEAYSVFSKNNIFPQAMLF